MADLSEKAQIVNGTKKNTSTPPRLPHLKDIVKYSLAISFFFFSFNGMECVFSISHQFQMPCKNCTEKDMLLSYFSCELPYAKSLNHTLLSL